MKRIFTSIIITSYCFFFAANTVSAQDARYSQLYASPLLLNPAMIGVHDGQFRAVVNYRELYASILADNPFRTISASFDMRFPVLQNDFFSFGVTALKDDVGIANFNRTSGTLGASFMKQLSGGGRHSDGEQYIVAGGQIGLGQRGFDWPNLWFSNQFDESESIIDYGGSTGESFSMDKTDLYLDFNAGVLWYAIFGERMSIYAGGSLHHINSPNISFLESEDEVLRRKYIGHAGGELPLSEQLSLLPSVAVISQGSSFSSTAGVSFRYTNREWREVALRVAGWGHLSNKLESNLAFDAFILGAVLETEKWNIGLSYDITTSSLSSANDGRGAFEIALIYIHPPSSRKLKVSCPNF